MKLLLCALALFLSVQAHSQNYCGREARYNYIFEEFTAMENQFLRWESRYQNAPMYSQERQISLDKMKDLKSEIEHYLKNAHMPSELYAKDILEISDYLSSQYKVAPLYSVKRELYLNTMKTSFNDYKVKANAEIECYTTNSRQVFDIARDYDKKYQNSALYSVERETYLALLNHSYDYGLEFLKYEYSQWREGFRPVEVQALEFQSFYNSSPLYSKAREANLKAAQMGYNKSYEIFNIQVRRMPQVRVERLYERFSKAYSEAPLYSSQRDFYLKMKNKAFEALR
ncbi:MAG: hypothetical protein KDD50_10335 [Bdellovibrionales bacterium]|nr:hypothetical protein [Bdellovibrionales bacterium]